MKILIPLYLFVSSLAFAQYEGGYGPTVASIPTLQCVQSSGYGSSLSSTTLVIDFLNNKVIELPSKRTFETTTVANLRAGYSYTVRYTYSDHWLVEMDVNYWPGNYASDATIDVRSSAFPGIWCSIRR